MITPYAGADALREARGLAGSGVVAEYCLSLDEYVRCGTGEPAMRSSCAAAASETRRRGLAPERMLRALRLISGGAPRLLPMESLGTSCDARYSRAVGLFLSDFFTG